MTLLARFRRAPRADPRQGEIDDLHARLARCEEARAAAEEARAVAVEDAEYWHKRFAALCKIAWKYESTIASLEGDIKGAKQALEMAWASNRERDRTIAELEAELAPYKGHVG